MSSYDSDDEKGYIENVKDMLNNLSKELKEVCLFRDLFFENHSTDLALEKNRLIEEKKQPLITYIEGIDENTQVPFEHRAEFLYLKGRCYNVGTTYDARATQCLSKAVKLNPDMVEAWNELGECYWKNLNVQEAKASFEGALKHERNKLSLRCLSIILRQESGSVKRSEANKAVINSVELAKEAVSHDVKDGISWTVLGNAYLCQFFMVAQDPATLKLCMSAYKQARTDPIARGQPDLYYNKGIALKYKENYEKALENFDHACRLDPPWEPPSQELKKLVQYLQKTDELVRTKGKIKQKKLAQMVQNIDKKMLGAYGPGSFHTFGTRRDVSLTHVPLDSLDVGTNEGKVVLGWVVGSIHNDNDVPFTFAMVDESMCCVCVTVYNWAEGRGVIIGDCVCVPEPRLALHTQDNHRAKFNFKSIRVNNPMILLVNGKRLNRNQYACVKITSTYEIH